MTAANINKQQVDPTFGAIDLGTNNCRLSIVKPVGNDFEIVDGFSRIVRLGQGLVTENELNQEAMDRTLQALNVCAKKMQHWAVEDMRCIATEACRQASNGEWFLEEVLRKTGLEFEVVTPELEASLTLSGVSPLIEKKDQNVLLFDIGGGSTEIVWAKTVGGEIDEIPGILSLPLGVVTLAESQSTDLSESEALTKIEAEVSSLILPFCEKFKIKDQISRGNVQMIGTSGTVTTLAALSLSLDHYERSKVDGLEISFDTLHQLVDKVGRMSLEERRQTACIGPGRADLVMFGCALLQGICRQWPVGKLIVADRGIREGLIIEMIERYRHNAASKI